MQWEARTAYRVSSQLLRRFYCRSTREQLGDGKYDGSSWRYVGADMGVAGLSSWMFRQGINDPEAVLYLTGRKETARRFHVNMEKKAPIMGP